jgi:hypothetical protein
VGTLTRYFLDNLMGRQLLDEDGIMGLRRVVIFAFTGVLSVGLYLPRVFHRKYADLAAIPDPEPYRQALIADSMLLICLTMMVTALAAALIAPAMYPDEIDYATLTPLPMPRRRIFGAKFAALAIFMGAFVIGGLVLFAISFPAFTQQVWAEQGRPLRMGSFATATIAGSIFAFFAVMAQQGLILVALPRRWVPRASMLAQSGTVAGLILAAPLIVGIAGRPGWAGGAAEMAWFPPAWFLGIEQSLLGRNDPSFSSLAGFGVVALALAGLAAVGCYVWLFRSAERLVSPPAQPRRPDEVAKIGRRESRRRHGGPWTAVWSFTTATLARNRLPQLIFLIAWSAGAAAAVTGVIEGWQARRAGGSAPPGLVNAAMAMPIVMSLLAAAGLRAAFLMPVRLPANWVFRMTDVPGARVDHLDAVEQAFVRLAILPALLISAPVQVAVLGPGRGLMALLVATLASAVLLEFVLIGWRRVPFTCTWLPGKRPLPFALMAVIAVIWVSASVSGFAAHTITRAPRGGVGLSVLLLTTAAVMRWLRLRSWAKRPLEFEDEPLHAVQRLGLGPG